VVVFEAPKVAVPVGTLLGVQLFGSKKLPDPGLVCQVASCARAGPAAGSVIARTRAVEASKAFRDGPPMMLCGEVALCAKVEDVLVSMVSPARRETRGRRMPIHPSSATSSTSLLPISATARRKRLESGGVMF
jgi:hypothetical protein